MNEAWRSFPIKDLTMTTNGKRGLLNEGYETLGDLDGIKEYELLRIPNFGRVSLQQFKDAVELVRTGQTMRVKDLTGHMGLRDWFAGSALAAMDLPMMVSEISAEKYARQAFWLADAMLKERDK